MLQYDSSNYTLDLSFSVVNNMLHGRYSEDRYEGEVHGRTQSLTFTFKDGIAVGRYDIYTSVMSGLSFGENKKSGFYNDKGALEGNQVEGGFGRGDWFSVTQYVCQNNICKSNKIFAYNDTLFYGKACGISSVLERQAETMAKYKGGAYDSIDTFISQLEEGQKTIDLVLKNIDKEQSKQKLL